MWETDSECKFENAPVFYNSQALLVVKIRLRWEASRIQDDSYYDNTEIVNTKNIKQVLICVTCILLPNEGLQEKIVLQSYNCEEVDPLLYKYWHV
jgi:hypothetical protein